MTVVSSVSSSAGRWDGWYRTAVPGVPRPYGDSTTYVKGATWLKDLHVEDWGCGLGWMRTFVDPALYRGVDGSHTPFADEIVDLATYRSTADGIFLRHVLEHNECWLEILRGAVASFRKRLVLVIFTPWQDETRRIGQTDVGPGILIPDIGFAREDITRELGALLVTEETLTTRTQYGVEHVLYCERPADPNAP